MTDIHFCHVGLDFWFLGFNCDHFPGSMFGGKCYVFPRLTVCFVVLILVDFVCICTTANPLRVCPGAGRALSGHPITVKHSYAFLQSLEG